MDKSTVIDTLEKMEDEFTTEELMDKLLFIEKVNKGLEDSEKGKVIPLKEVKERMANKWK